MLRAVMAKLTRKPKSVASKELTELSKESFVNKLNAWQEKHKDFLKKTYI